jgi:formate dehydrogenase beta subunit
MKYKAKVPDLIWYRSNVLCMEACPVHTDSGRYVQLISQGENKEAYLVARSSNPFASVCGRICAAPCEDACRRGKIDEAVAIRSLKRFITEQYGVESPRPDIPELLNEGKVVPQGSIWSRHVPSLLSRHKGKAEGKKVAVIGAGPTGLACAHDLNLMGYQVTIFESSHTLGGMPRTAIPEYRLPKDVLRKEAEFILSQGIDIKFKTPLTKQFGLNDIKKLGYEAVFISVGMQLSRDLNIEGVDQEGVHKAVDYLFQVNSGSKIDLGKKTVVIGGGLVALDSARTALREVLASLSDSDEARLAIDISADAGVMMTALDVARTALRRGTLKVDVASLESFEEMPAKQTLQGYEEFEESEKEGITFHPSRGPKRIIGENRRVKAVEFLKVKRVFDEQGKFNPEFEPGTEEIIEADTVILAIGQMPDLSFIRPEDGVKLTPQGTIAVDPETLATTREGVYAGGDVAFGARIMIEGVANGKRAAQSIDYYLSQRKKSKKISAVSIEVLSPQEYKKPWEYEQSKRKTPPKISPQHRIGANEVERVFKEEDAKNQAQRCLVCHINTIYDSELCVLCGACVDHCPHNCLKLVPPSRIDLEQEEIREKIMVKKSKLSTAMIKDEITCIRCGLCATVCPTGAMTMERFTFKEIEEN